MTTAERLSTAELHAENERLRVLLEQSERRSRAIFNSSTSYAIVITDRVGRVTDWNSGAEHILQWSAAEIVGQSADRFFTPEDCASGQVHKEMRAALAKGRASDERWHLRKDGSRFFASGEMMPLRGPADEHLGFIKILRDRTAEHLAGRILEETKAFLHRAQVVGGVGMFHLDVSDNILHATPEFCRLYGLAERESFPAELVEDLVHPDDVQLRSDAAARRRGDIMNEVVYRIRRADSGEERWIARKAEIQRDASGLPTRFVGTAHDITAQMLAQNQLAAEREQLAQMFEQAPTFMALLRGPEHRFERVNPGFKRLIDGRDVVGATMQEALPDAVAQGYLDLLNEVYRSGQPYAAESAKFVVQASPADPAHERFLDFVYQPIRDTGGVVSGIFVEGVDVTARTVARAERRDDERRQRTLLELADTIRDMSDPAELAFASSEILGKALGVTRVGYGTVDTAAETIVIEREWDAPGIRNLAGTLQFRNYGSYIEDVKRGETVAIGDVEADPRTRDNAAALKAISACAFINMPMVEHGQLVAMLYVNNVAPRTWSEADLRFVREAGERVRVATERLRSEQALRQSEEQFRVFAQAVPNQIWAGGPDGHLDWFNQQVYTYSGAAPGALDGSAAWAGIVHPDDLPTAGAAWAQALADGAVYEAEFRIRRADGRYRWFLVRALPVRDPDGHVMRWVGTNTDIDERRRQAAELAALNATLELQVEERTRDRDRVWSSTNDLMATAGLDGYLKIVNPAWTRMLGWEDAELLAMPFLELVDPIDHASIHDVVRRLAAQEAVRDFVDHVLRKDGGQRTIMWDATPSGDVFHIVGRDITALRHAEEQLRQSQKMEAVGQLTGGLAHDFNNLLTGITGSLDLMTTRIAQGRFKDIERYAAAAQGAAKRAAALTHRLLAFSRRQTLDPKPTDVNRLVAGMADLTRRTVGPAIEVEIVAAGGLWPTLVDPNQLENALLNLCINARDAMPGGGRLTIETGNRWLDARAAQERDLAPGQYSSLCVSDTGTGMSSDVVSKAFDPFFTTKPIGQGTGLGLSMIYGFAKQSGGQVRIYSELGEGAMVCIYLPRHLGQADEAEAPPEFGNAPRAAAGETVLVVDDEPTVRMLVTEVLEELGYAAIEAADGASGLKVLQSDARIDLLVTDVGLPGGMNGRQMADAARAHRPKLNVLFITGYAENAVVGNGHLAPGMHVMTKPFAMEALASRIKELISDP